MSELFRRRQS